MQGCKTIYIVDTIIDVIIIKILLPMLKQQEIKNLSNNQENKKIGM